VLKNQGTIYSICFPAEFVNGKTIFNPSISISQDGIGTLVFRTTNYRYLRPTGSFTSLTSTGAIQYLLPRKQVARSSFFLAQHNFSSNHSKPYTNISFERFFLPDLPKSSEYNFESIEDLRICAQDLKFTLLGNILVSDNRRRPFYFETEFLPQDAALIQLKNMKLIEFPYMAKIEKNWVQIEGEPNLVVRWPLGTKSSENNIAITSLLKDQFDNYEEFQEEPNLFGGSPFIKYLDGYLTVVHERKFGNRKNNHEYFHKFLYYNNDFQLVKSSIPFSFFGFETEFCSGLTIYLDKVFISISCNDSLNFVISFNKFSNILEADFE
jgi:hypothetical protein